MSETITKPLQYFIFGASFLLSLYIFLMRITTGSFEAVVAQFSLYKFWILALSVGFGIQLALYRLIKAKHMETPTTEKVAKAAGITSATTMAACCIHHAVDILPIIGISALASFLGAYTRELFLVGIFSNLLGISYMLKQYAKI